MFRWENLYLYTRFNKSNSTMQMQGTLTHLLFDMTTATTITQPIVKEVRVDYLGYVSTVPPTFICSHAQTPAPKNKAKTETISCGCPALWPWTDCCRPSFLRFQAMAEVSSNARRSPNLTTPSRIRLRWKQIQGRGPRGSTSCSKTLATISQPIFCTGEIFRLSAMLFNLTLRFTAHIPSIYCRTCKLLPTWVVVVSHRGI